MRADAQRNRERIVKVAREAFDTAQRPTLQSVARAAGVGQATLYRHFPTREALLVEAYRAEFEALLEAGPAAVERHGNGLALRRWLDDLAVLGRMKHALADVLDAAARAQLHQDQLHRVLGAVEDLLAAGRVAGTVRRDVTAEDLLALVSFLWHVDLDEPRAARLLDRVIAGLAPPA